MDAKLRIKMGEVEVEYEGSDDFLRKELPELLKAVLELHSNATDVSKSRNPASDTAVEKGRSQTLKVSTSTAASKLAAKRGSDLALAAAAALVIGDGKESFSRAELLRSMQSAKAYYKTTYRSNLSNYIATLVKSQDLLDHGGENYGLHDKKRKELENTLA